MQFAFIFVQRILSEFSTLLLKIIYRFLIQNTEDYLFQVILEKTIRIPRSLSVKAATVLKAFLEKSPGQRLGCSQENPFMDIVQHPFFKSIDWESVSIAYFQFQNGNVSAFTIFFCFAFKNCPQN